MNCGYSSGTTDQIFSQVKKKSIHESMDPKSIRLREARDSEVHPNTYPIIIALDVTGSMRDVPLYFLREYLTKIISRIQQSGFQDLAILIMAVGDGICDRAPLQVGQFESGDVELDLWLTRIWPEGGGGGNAGESYHLAWYFASKFIEHDSWDKRNKKGLLLTIGDEPNLSQLTSKEIQEIFDIQDKTYSDSELLEMAESKFDVYHLHVNHSSQSYSAERYWKKLLNQHCLATNKHDDSPRLISDLVLNLIGELGPHDVPIADPLSSMKDQIVL